MLVCFDDFLGQELPRHITEVIRPMTRNLSCCLPIRYQAQIGCPDIILTCIHALGDKQLMSSYIRFVAQTDGPIQNLFSPLNLSRWELLNYIRSWNVLTTFFGSTMPRHVSYQGRGKLVTMLFTHKLSDTKMVASIFAPHACMPLEDKGWRHHTLLTFRKFKIFCNSVDLIQNLSSPLNLARRDFRN